MKRSVRILGFGALILLCVIAVLSVAVSGGLGTSVESNGRYMTTATLPYNYDFDSVDRDLLHEKLAEVIGETFEVGIARNFIHGYPEVLISSLEHFSVSDDAIISKLNDSFPGMNIENVDHFDLSVKKSGFEYFITSCVLTLAMFLAVVLYCIFTGQSIMIAVKWLVVAVLALLASLFFENFVGCRNGDSVLLYSFISIVISTAAVMWTARNDQKTEDNNPWYKNIVLRTVLLSAVLLCGTWGTGFLFDIPTKTEAVLIAAAAIIPTIVAAAVSIPVLFSKK